MIAAGAAFNEYAEKYKNGMSDDLYQALYITGICHYDIDAAGRRHSVCHLVRMRVLSVDYARGAVAPKIENTEKLLKGEREMIKYMIITAAIAMLFTFAARAQAAAPESVFPLGQPNDAYAQYFTGQSYLAMLTTEGVPIANVTFEPGCRNNWHIHHAKKVGGQILLCTAGRGWYQEWGKEARELHPGDAVVIPAGVKHWHGAAKDSWFAHLAVEVPGEDGSTEWCEAVDDAQYGKLK